MPLLWALGWIVTTLAGIPVEEQFTIFGASGAVTFSALSGSCCCTGSLPAGSVTADRHRARRRPGSRERA